MQRIREHKCVHERYAITPSISYLQEKLDHADRMLSSPKKEPIRITTDFSNLNGIENEVNLKPYIEKLLKTS